MYFKVRKSLTGNRWKSLGVMLNAEEVQRIENLNVGSTIQTSGSPIESYLSEVETVGFGYKE